MQAIRSYAVFFILLLTMTQYTGVNAQRRHRRQQQETEIAEKVENLKSKNLLTKQLLEIEDLEITTQHNLLEQIEKAQQKQQEYEYEIQQQQEKLRILKEQYEYELQEQQRQQEQLEQQRQYKHEQEQQRQRLYEYELKQKQKKKQQQQTQQYNPNTDTYITDDAHFDYNPAESNFYEHYSDGSYAFGYALPNGVRRFERSYYSDEIEGMLVEGFYTELRDWGTYTNYELHCYRSGPYGYIPMKVRTLDHAPLVRRNTTLDDDCFDN